MKRAYIVAGVFAIAAASAAVPASAVPRTSAPSQSIVDTVHWRDHCVRWRHTCTARWGWGTWRYRRCMVFHGCR